MAEIIDGKQMADEIIAKVTEKAQELKEQHDRTPGLAVILVGDDPASSVYVASKGKKAEQCGFYTTTVKLDENADQAEVLKHIDEMNKDDRISGILVQLPLPEHLNEREILQAIDPDKDVDGLNYVNAGKLASGAKDGFIPCTPAGIMHMVRSVLGDDLSEMDAVVVGRSNIVGKPVAALLLAENATVTLTHSHTRELPEVVRSADILVVAAGKAEMVKGSWIKPGSTVIDVGINRVPAPKGSKKETMLVGDVEFDTASIIAKHITPVPGGVGPMTIAMLMVNTLKGAYLAAGLPAPEIA